MSNLSSYLIITTTILYSLNFSHIRANRIERGLWKAHTKDKNTTLTLSGLFEAYNLKRGRAPTRATNI
jgi:hypothetical protein